jgi:hypothetical protein
MCFILCVYCGLIFRIGGDARANILFVAETSSRAQIPLMESSAGGLSKVNVDSDIPFAFYTSGNSDSLIPSHNHAPFV